ncbi:MAG: RNA polymerase sigma factor [Isosphaeraceae bacterium]
MSRFFSKTRALMGRGRRREADEEVRAWAERYRAGNPEAREEVFRRLAVEGEPLVRKRRAAYPVVIALEEAGDVLQEALTKLFKRFEANPDRIPETVEELRLALRGAIDDVLIDACRKHLGPHGWKRNHVLERNSGLDVDAELTSVTGQVRRAEAQSRLAVAISELPQNHREALLLRECQGLTFVEIGRRLGIHRRTAGDWYEAALTTLRDQLHELDPRTS